MTNKSFCPAPWNSFFVNPDGAVENCCVSRNKLGNIDDVPDIKKIIFSDKNLKIQQDMLDVSGVMILLIVCKKDFLIYSKMLTPTHCTRRLANLNWDIWILDGITHAI